MAQATINIGTISNDGTGDTLRTAFRKTNNNFTELYSTTANINANLVALSVSVDTFEGQILTLSEAAFDVANAAYQFSNNQYVAMNAAFTMANTVNSLFYGATTNATAAFDMANSTVIRTNTIFSLTNTSFGVANAAFNLANTLNPTALAIIANATAAFTAANNALLYAGAAFDEANAALTFATIIDANGKSAYNFANGVSANTTASYRVANSAYNVTNASFGITNSVYFLTNSAYNTTNAAYTLANSKIATVNGTATGVFTVVGRQQITGNQIVTGNQNVTGQVTVTGPTNQFQIIDGYIYINGTLWSPTPPGTVIHTAASTPPTGYLKANGQAVSRITYNELFAAIGTTYGNGNGSTTFNLPDLRGTFIRSLDDGKGYDSGRALGSYQADIFKSHTHEDAGHTHQYAKPSTTTQALGFSGSNYTHPQTAPNATTAEGFADIQATGGSETRPKNVALLACIKF